MLASNDMQHINLIELDAMMKGINLALQWQAKVVHLYTESACMYQWLMNTLTGKTQERMKATSKMLMCQRLANLQQLIEEYSLVVNIRLTTSEKNLANTLTQVPKKWLNMLKQGSEPPTCAAMMNWLTNKQMCIRHSKGKHPGMWCRILVNSIEYIQKDPPQ